jgi:hypothetical protein
MIYGDQSYFCRVIKIAILFFNKLLTITYFNQTQNSSICSTLFCYTPNGCLSLVSGAAEGSTCDSGKVG